MKRALAVALVVSALGGSLAARAGAQIPPGPISLRFAPLSAPLTFRHRDVTVEVKLKGGEPPLTRRTELARTLRRSVMPGTSETLRVKIETLDVSAMRDGVSSPPPPAMAPLMLLLTSRGLKVTPEGPGGPPSPLALVLPDEPLPAPLEVLGLCKLDDRPWTARSGPTTEVPIAVTTSYRATGIETCAGRSCVVIAMSARESGRVENGKRLVELFARGRYLFDPVAGVVLDARTELRLDDAALPPPKAGLQRVHTETLSTAVLLPRH